MMVGSRRTAWIYKPMNDELIYQFATTDDEVEAYEIMLLLTQYYLSVYDSEKDEFAASHNVNTQAIMDESLRAEYALYISNIFSGMRDRVKEEEGRLSGLGEGAALLALKKFVFENYGRIEETELSNAKQMARLQVAQEIQSKNTAAKIYKRWVARPGCCEVCRALNGTVKPIDEPFLINGQVVELEGGKSFTYGYIDRNVAIAHPNDRCTVEFFIEY